ncbi:MAG: hypothetical protein A2Z16_01855 [Chloroflexi bacterium RBG_16_54_18]|nr:MAG: hypothetical protein A2Z16_01855 [Chloroflexi bacterium RBG_16_54_18]
MPLSQGQILNNRYKIVKLLGQGGFGAVYRAWDANLERLCAVKENYDISPDAERLFKRESKILVDLSHPNLPRVFDYFSIPSKGNYFVMDYIEGYDLQEKLDQRGGPLTETEVLPWITQVCDALAYLHGRIPPIIHRDIKPSNVRINPYGIAFLVDFGIAKVYDPHRRTTMGARAVTPGYAPFEQYGQKSTDARTDVYALGATLYHALTGITPLESIDRVAGAQLSTPRELNPFLTPTTEAVILRAMEILPEKRYQQIQEFLYALKLPTEPQGQVFAAVTPTQILIPQSTYSSSTPEVKPVRIWLPKKLIIALLGLLLIIPLLILLIYSSRKLIANVSPRETNSILGFDSEQTWTVAPSLGDYAPFVTDSPLHTSTSTLESSINTPIDTNTQVSDQTPFPKYSSRISTENLDQLVELAEIRLSGIGISSWIEWAPDSRYLAVSTQNSVQIYNISTQTAKFFIRTLSRPLQIDISPDGQYIAVGSEGSIASIWRIADNSLFMTLKAKYKHVYVAFAPDGKNIAVSSEHGPGDITVWDFNSGEQSSTTFIEMGVGYLGFSPDGDVIASNASGRGNVLSWKFPGLDPIYLTSGPLHRDNISSLVFSPDSTKLAISSLDGRISLLRSPELQLIYRTYTIADSVYHIDFSPDGKILAVGSSKATLQFLLAANGNIIESIPLSGNLTCYTVAFSPDGYFLATTSNGRIRIWGVIP